MIGIWAVILCVATTGLFLSSCQNSDDLLKPGSVPIDVMTATFLPDSVFNLNPIDLNGEVLEREWGGPLDADLPFSQIRLSRENGAGDVGDPIFVSAKAIYTENDIYFLFRWIDQQPDEMKDALYFLGDGVRACDDARIDPEMWSFNDPLTAPNNARKEEDRFSIVFEIDPSGDDRSSFAEAGCQIACHTQQSPAFGAPGHGRLDLWQWLATRTNLVRDLYNDLENPAFPARGIPGYLEDQTLDPISGLAADPGTPTWRLNFEPGSAVPKFVYRDGDDPFKNPPQPAFCFNDFGERCLANNGLPPYYIWRENVEFDGSLPYAECDSINQAVLPAGTENRPWLLGDAVSGYVFTYPSGSRADVHGKAQFNDGVWSLEIGRPLNTFDPANDIIFTGEAGTEVSFAIAVFDNSGFTHWGSGPQILKFGSKGEFDDGTDGGAGRPTKDQEDGR